MDNAATIDLFSAPFWCAVAVACIVMIPMVSGSGRLPPESAAERAERLELAQVLGWFDPGRYSPETPNSRALVELIREGRATGAKVGIILMPEHSLFRTRCPAEAGECFAKINRINFPDDPVPVYDLRDRIADDLFRDLLHPGVDAVEPISIPVGESVRDLLSGHPSPERLRLRAREASSRADGRRDQGLPSPNGDHAIDPSSTQSNR
jgi:hypothetical protein